MRTVIFGWRRPVAAAMAFLCLVGTAHGQSLPPSQPSPSLPVLRTALAQPHALRDATARQRVALQSSGRRKSSSATKATAVGAMGFVGFWTGAILGWLTAYGLQTSAGGAKAAMWTGGIGGAIGGGYLGGWLASR